MKTLLLLALIAVSNGYGQSFSGSIIDLQSGRTQLITGNISPTTQGKLDGSASYSEMADSLAAITEARNQEYMQYLQLQEMRRQTEILEKISRQ